VIKFISAANRNPNLALSEFHRQWTEDHGGLGVHLKWMLRYTQHMSLPETYGSDLEPSYDGASIHWVDDLDVLRAFPHPSKDPRDVTLRETFLRHDGELFDRSLGWPRDHKRAWVTANERAVLEGEVSPDMVKLILLVSRRPGLTFEDFFDHWFSVHGSLCAKVPGLRRCLQNHAIREAYSFRPVTHDGWSEMWFDDLSALRQAMSSPEWQAVEEDGNRLFADPVARVVGRETTVKWGDYVIQDGGAKEMSEGQIRDKLARQGYRRLAADPLAPKLIKAAAMNGALALWNERLIVTLDLSRIDARPEG
jgi:uncharacterized protein (TIGR02118 family)